MFRTTIQQTDAILFILCLFSVSLSWNFYNSKKQYFRLTGNPYQNSDVNLPLRKKKLKISFF